ncbi:MFS transporter [Aestuariispira insulae]|uniref:Putative MFS family arabinose efflux permease n=1 Tax=Aestuariispira insulae TaxID=1461337 RepID=A0A3D9HRK7_9PROT|nr:MFS transporter [Aestuariispira insulae]RED52144.1 putative MFS family arabinose efflux permease [Aestuariispira insulae]
MWTAIKSISSLLLSYGLLLLGNGMMGILLGLRSRIEGFSTEITGLIMSGYFIGMLVGALFAVRVIATVGHVRAFAALASLLSVAVLAHVLIVDPVAWFVLRVMAGFCMSGMVMVVESWVNERSTNAMRGRILSLYMITNYLGAGLGQFMMLIGDPAEYQLFIIASMVYSFALVPVLLSRASAPKPSSPQRMPFKDLFLTSPVGVMGTICAGVANASLNGMGAVFAREIGLSVAQVSTFMAMTILGGIALQFPIGRLSDRFDRRSVLIGASVFTALLAQAALWATDQPFIILVLIITAYGGFAFVVYPISSSQVNDLADPDRLVQVASGLLIAYGIGASMGPILAAQAMARFGADGFLYFLTGIYCFLALFILVRMTQRRRAVRPKAPFLPLGSMGTSSKQLYTAALSDSGQKEEDTH